MRKYPPTDAAFHSSAGGIDVYAGPQLGRARYAMLSRPLTIVLVVFSFALTTSLVSCGEEDPFVEKPKPPIISSSTVTEVSGTTARLAATVNPRGSRTVYACEYSARGLTDTTPWHDAGDGVGSVPAEVVLSPLMPDTRYLYHWKVSNDGGVVTSDVDSFVTLPSPIPDPETWVSAPPPNVGPDEVMVHLFWGGFVAYGVLSHFEWGAMLSDTLVAVPFTWAKILENDSTFAIERNVADEWWFWIRAVDNAGHVDPTPATYVLQLTE